MPRTATQERTAESKVTLTLFIDGDPTKVQDVRRQVEHYASALPGVRVDN